jgi:TonB family protein
VKSILLAAVAFLAASNCGAQISLFPRHIEQPSYPRIALTAKVQGTVVLNVTIDAAGHVIEAKAVDGTPLLFAAAEKNMSVWTFDRPATAPLVETFVYEFRIEEQPYKSGECEKVIYDVTYDLPGHAKVVAKEWRAPDTGIKPSKN